MDQTTVRNLEDEIEEAIAELMSKSGSKHLPFRPVTADHASDGEGGSNSL